MLPRIHKTNYPGRSIVNSIESITENISVYKNECLRPVIPRIPTYIKDESHFLNIIMERKLNDENLLVIIDVFSLYTNIPCCEGISSISRSLEDVQVEIIGNRNLEIIPKKPNVWIRFIDDIYDMATWKKRIR